MNCRTGTFRHGFRFGGSRINPAGMSIEPGVATPMAAIRSSVSPAAATARRIVSAMTARPCSWPLAASVGRLADGAERPAVSSTTPAFMVVPPTSRPTNTGELLMRSRWGKVRGWG